VFLHTDGRQKLLMTTGVGPKVCGGTLEKAAFRTKHYKKFTRQYTLVAKGFESWHSNVRVYLGWSQPSRITAATRTFVPDAGRYET